MRAGGKPAMPESFLEAETALSAVLASENVRERAQWVVVRH